MAETSTNMGLIRWTNVNDLFNSTQLAQNFERIDLHDHTGGPTKGVPIPTAGLANLAVTTAKLADLNVTTGKIADGAVATAKVADRAVTAPKVGVLPQARVFHNVNQTIPNASITVVAMNAERWDTDGIHDTATNNHRLVCKTAGLYLLSFHVEWAANATGSRYAGIRLNTGGVIAVDRSPSLGASTMVRQSISTVYRLSVNDYVEPIVQQDTGVGLDIVGGTGYSPEFTMTFLSNF